VRVPNGRCFERSTRLARSWPAPFRDVILAAMAWNNLVTFPYLCGYSSVTLDRLMRDHGFMRIRIDGDVLVTLSDAETKAWAVLEERVLKSAWRLASNTARIASQPDVAPWMNAYYVAG